MSEVLDCAVVGGGLAGLMAARELGQAGARVAVFEARDRVGGRVLSGRASSGRVVDLGASFVSPEHSTLRGLMQEFGVERASTWTGGSVVAGQLDGSVARYSGGGWGLGPEGDAEVERLIDGLDVFAKGVDVSRPWLVGGDLDSRTVRDWLDSEQPRADVRHVLDGLLRSTFCAALGRVSLLYASFYFRAIGGLASGTSVAIVFYERPFWRDAGLSGEVLRVPPTSDAYDLSSERDGMIMAFIVGEDADRLATLSAQSRRDRIVDALGRALGHGGTPTEYIEKEWTSETWTRGCYGPVVGPGMITGYGSALNGPHGRLHFAGADTWGRFHGHMEGALRSGLRAAADLS